MKMRLLSTVSTKKSLLAICKGDAGLNEKRKSLLSRVSVRNSYATFAGNSIKIKDLAYLSAYTGDEFALLRGKDYDVLFHGEIESCTFYRELKEKLKQHKLELVAHSHPDYDIIIPSKDDRDFLKEIGQNSSIIISWYTGNTAEYFADEFMIQ